MKKGIIKFYAATVSFGIVGWLFFSGLGQLIYNKLETSVFVLNFIFGISTAMLLAIYFLVLASKREDDPSSFGCTQGSNLPGCGYFIFSLPITLGASYLFAYTTGMPLSSFWIVVAISTSASVSGVASEIIKDDL